MFTFIRSNYNQSECCFQHPLVIDPIGTQEFQVNSFGWYDSDITTLINAQSMSVQDNIMNRLSILSKTANTDLTDAQLLKVLIPRYCQSFGERSKFMEYLKESSPDLFEQVSKDEEKRAEPEPSHESDSSE